jgi:hypothetical protein
MSYLDGQPIETLADMAAAECNAAATDLLRLALREVFDWGLVQTDPNFANYLYQPDTERIQLLDFGATREYSTRQRGVLRSLLRACIQGADADADVAEAARNAGYLDTSDPPGYGASVVALLRAATEPARADDRYAFGRADLAHRMREIVVDMHVRNHYGRLPPSNILFLHRKLGGLYLLLARLSATIPVRELIMPYLERLEDEPAG